MLIYLKEKISIIMIFIMDSQVVLPQVTNDTGLIYIN